MSAAAPHTVNRSRWSRGPWDNEPDKAEWRTAAGYHAIALRVHHGAWCGYVAVPPGHPCHGADYETETTSDLEVHGGLTYASACHGNVCHVPAPGEPDNVWWIGFDTAHGGGLSPNGAHNAYVGGLVYRTLEYVKAECESLASQLAAKAVQP